ncbi:Gfo/Idh/MocA family protein [Candidatus Poribacteria bacterium]
MKEYRAAIMGCGRMSRGHAAAYKTLNIPIVAGADISQEALDKARESYGAERTYKDYRKLLDEVKPDLVSVVTAELLHCEMVVAAAEAGVKGIMCEKPMAMNLDEGQRMIDACRASGSKLTISHQRYYNPQYSRARELIAQGAIGKARFVEAIGMAPSIHTDGTHTIHMLMSLLGDPKVSHLIAQIDGNSDYQYFGHRCDHGGNAFLNFENGCYAHLTWGLHTHGSQERLHPLWNFDRYHYHSFMVYGDEGRLELDGDLMVRGADAEPPDLLRIVRGAEVESIPYQWPVEKGAIALELEDLLKSIESDAPHPLSGENGYAVLEVIMGIYESSRRRGVVHFPVEVQDNPFLAMCEAGIFP